MADAAVYVCEDIIDLASPFHSFVERPTRRLVHVQLAEAVTNAPRRRRYITMSRRRLPSANLA